MSCHEDRQGAEEEACWYGPYELEETWRIQCSNDEYAYGCVVVPIVALGPTSGPRVVVIAGNHGDEFEGQVAAHRLIEALREKALSGRVVIVPCLNYPAVLVQRRTSPVDGGNMNRSFPGRDGAGPTASVARAVTDLLLSECAFALDLHSGGRATRYVPSSFIRITEGDDAIRRREKLHAARLLGFSDVLIVGTQSDDRSLSAECDRAGVISVAAELGGGASVDRRLVELAVQGVLRLLRHWGVLDATTTREEALPNEPRRLILNGKDQVVMCRQYGLFEPSCDVGQEVEQGAELGRIYSLERPASAPSVVASAVDGVVAIQRLPPVVVPGDYLCTVATRWPGP